MSNDFTPAIARPIIRTVVVPDNIYSASKRSNSHLMDLLIFGKLRKFCSLEDIAVYCAINDHLKIDGVPIASAEMKQIMEIGDGNEAEYDGILNKMSLTDEIKKLSLSIIESYTGAVGSALALSKQSGIATVTPDRSVINTISNGNHGSDLLPYQLKTSGSNVFVVVGTGFDKYVGAHSDKNLSKTFIRDFLELCDGLYSPSEVARHPLFKSFLTHLQSK